MDLLRFLPDRCSVKLYIVFTNLRMGNQVVTVPDWNFGVDYHSFAGSKPVPSAWFHLNPLKSVFNTKIFFSLLHFHINVCEGFNKYSYFIILVIHIEYHLVPANIEVSARCWVLFSLSFQTLLRDPLRANCRFSFWGEMMNFVDFHN